MERNRIPQKFIWFSFISILATRLIFFAIYAVKFQNVSFAGFLSHADIWDSEWYRSIANEGYPVSATATSSWAFFPLYPLAAKGVSLITHLDVDTAGFLVSNICFFVACLYSYCYVMITRRNEEEAYFYTALITWGLCGFYDGILYTEAMYLMFLTMCFYYLKSRQYVKMGICGALMSATRNTGVFFVFVILFDQIHLWRNQSKKALYGEKQGLLQSEMAGTDLKTKSTKNFPEKPEKIDKRIKSDKGISSFMKFIFSQEKLVFGTMLVPAGLFAYMQYLYFRTGDGLAFVHIQKAFMKDTKAGIVNVWMRVFRLYRGQLWVYAYLIALLLVLALILLGLRNHRSDEVVWGVLNWFIPQQRGLGSMQRYFHTCIVVELTFCDYCMKLKRWMRWMILIVAFLINCVMMGMWLDGNGWNGNEWFL